MTDKINKTLSFQKMKHIASFQAQIKICQTKYSE